MALVKALAPFVTSMTCGCVRTDTGRWARQTIVLADRAIALHRIAPITAIHTVITDAAAEAGAIEGLRSAGIEVLTV